MGEVLGALWIAVPVAVLFTVAEVLYRTGRVEVEYTRKLTHLGSGVVVLSMPWVVSTHWSVLALSVGFVAVLVLTKWLGWLPSVHAVSRKTSGAQYYPIAVYGTYLLADGRPFFYMVPMMVMALADTGAAVVGRRHAIVRYRVVEDFRSLGGSLTFFGLTFGVVIVGLSLVSHGHLPTVLLVALLTSMVATAVEGISVRGIDNLLVPYATWLVLDRTLGATRDGLGEWVLGATLVFALLIMTFRQARLTTTGFMAAFVAGFLAWGLGGPVWLATFLVPYAGFTASRPVTLSGTEGDLGIVVPAFLVPLALLLLHAHLPHPALFVPFLGAIAAISATGLAGFLRSRFDSWVLEGVGAPLGAAVAFVPSLVLPSPLDALGGASSVIAIVVGAGALLGPVVARVLLRHGESKGLARLAGVLSGTAPSAVWAALHLHG